MIALRDYQQAMIDDAREAYRRGARSVLLNLPTGGGKTVTASHIVHSSAMKGKVCWWLCHRRELLAQASATFHSFDIPHSTIRSGHVADPMARVQVASIQTIANRLDDLPPPDFIVFDETHHIGAASWDKIFRRYPAAKIMGLTATPWRLDGKGLGAWYQAMVSGPTPADLIASGSLSPFRLFAPAQPDLSGVDTVAGDYQRSALARAMDKPAIVGDAISHYRRLCSGKRAVAFAVGVDHSQNIAAEFRAAGIPAEHVDGSMSEAERDGAVERFRRGETLVLTNADLFGEGFDVPAIEAAILLRPTKSLSLYLQQVGRALRPMPGKDAAIILDHAGNSLVHGLPDDVRTWSLEDRPKRAKGQASDSPVRQCTECFFVFRPAPVCPQCGHRHTAPVREIETVEGTLEEVRRVEARQRRIEQGRADSFEALVELGRQRGYKNPAFWASKVWASRSGRRAA
ncbi:SSL2 DNA or RNA helicases of superfamily II [uncultured Caudovirales phage]|uniref:SSL2 DNA or RNA helicases of superfamily II n=1 Tax=uncultured Caudovirales phage TaxID=2100421 RepID=A0A6J5M0Q6_9CAUD|nr:SSL2 DNA or RNA helicases of superfamily II [uncultured Caudovirales phage]